MSRLLVVGDVALCPTCGSADVVYTCEPKCCFNHVCSDCRSTFQIVTDKKVGERQAARADVPAPGSSDPTAPCAVCESVRLYVVANLSGEASLACADCGTMLELDYEEIAPA